MEPTRERHVRSNLVGTIPIIIDKHERVDEINIEVSIEQVGQGNDNINIANSELILESKHKDFLSHSGAQKDFVEQLCVDLERCDRYPFFDKLRTSLPVGQKFPTLIFNAIKQCRVGIVVLSKEFLMSKWPMLELHAMVEEFEKPDARITIIPVFYCISIKALEDPKNVSRWTSQWKKWALSDMRIHLDEWKKVLKVLGSINGIVMKEDFGDVKLREEIVAQVCGLVRCETRWNDSHVQGCTRISKIVQDKVNEVQTNSGISLIGLYGMGGIGKTTISKALCNDLLPKFGDKVCHIEFGSGSEMELLRKALKKLTNVHHDILDKLDNIGEGYAYLKSEQSIFLMLDNVQDDLKGMEIAQRYLKAGYGHGSVVLVTARSLDVLKGLNVNAHNCMEMPKLKKLEARSLFLKCADLPLENQVNEVLIKKCIERCHFHKGDGRSKQYHPLALKVLGQQFGYDPRRWEIQLNKMKTFDQRGDKEHPVFSILRNSFYSLKLEHQVIFMDLALLVTHAYDNPGTGMTRRDCLCMLHETSVEDMKDKLEVLKGKSLVEELSDDFSKIGIHDLWFEFAVAETKAKDFRDRRWVFQMDGKKDELGRSGQWKENVERMFFSNEGWKSLMGLNLNDFENVEAFKLSINNYVPGRELHLDLSGLKLLRSLDVYAPGLTIKAQELGCLTNLAFLYYRAPGFSPCLNEIGRLTNLQYLELWHCKGVKVLDFSKLNLLLTAVISDLRDLVVVKGFSSRFADLRFLRMLRCKSLRECLGVDELNALEHLQLYGCGKIEQLPCLRRLINLKLLDIAECKCLRAVPGLSDLVALEVFHARRCSKLAPLADLVKLTKLRELDIWECPVQEVPGWDGLISLTLLVASFGRLLGEQPAVSKLSTLKLVTIKEWNGPFLTTIRSLLMLEHLALCDCKGEDVVPDLQNLKRLKLVVFEQCEYKDLSGLSNLTALETLWIGNCYQLEKLPEFERLVKLTYLHFTGCDNLKEWPSEGTLCSLRSLSVDESSLMKIVRDLETMTGLRELCLEGSGCENVLSMASVTSRLEILRIYFNFATTEELDLSSFPRLKVLELWYCSVLRRVGCSNPLTRLTVLKVSRCESLVEMPDLSTFPHLEELQLQHCRAVTRLTCSSPLTALRQIELIGCNRRVVVPELSMFPNLEVFDTPVVEEASSGGQKWGLFRRFFCHSQ